MNDRHDIILHIKEDPGIGTPDVNATITPRSGSYFVRGDVDLLHPVTDLYATDKRHWSAHLLNAPVRLYRVLTRLIPPDVGDPNIIHASDETELSDGDTLWFWGIRSPQKYRFRVS